MIHKILLVLAALLFSTGCSQMVADRVLRPPRFAQFVESARVKRAAAVAEWDGQLRDFTYKSTDGLRLCASIITPTTQPARGLVVLVHGLSEQKELTLPYASMFARRGYVAVCPDLRAHGQSGGQYTSFGEHEKWDMVALLNSLKEQGFDVTRVGAMGGSLGAAVAIQWAGVDPRVKAIIAVAPFAELRTEAAYQLARLDPPLARPVVEYVQSAVEYRGNFQVSHVSALKAIKSMDTPIYLLHGEKDTIIPISESDRLFAATTGPSVLQHVPGAGHMNVVKRAGPEFLERAMAWMDAFASTDKTMPPEWIKTLIHPRVAVIDP